MEGLTKKIRDRLRELHHRFGHSDGADHEHGQHREYGRRHDGREEIAANPAALIVEGQEGIDSFDGDLSGLHCNGCPLQCPLSAPHCGKGRRAAELIARR